MVIRKREDLVKRFSPGLPFLCAEEGMGWSMVVGEQDGIAWVVEFVLL